MSVFAHIFMWDYDYLYSYKIYNINFANPKILFCFFLIYHLINFYSLLFKNYKEAFKKSKVIIFFFLLISLHLIMNLNERNSEPQIFLRLLFFFFIFIFCYNFYDKINNSIKYLTYTFLILISVSIFFGVILQLSLITAQFNIFFRENFLFKENSHFAMVAVPVILFCIVSVKKNFSYLTLLVFVFTFLSAFFYYSSTFALGLLTSIFFLFIFFFKEFKKKIFIILFAACFLFLGSEFRNYISKNFSISIISLVNDSKFNSIKKNKYNFSDEILTDSIIIKKKALQAEWSKERNLNIRDFFLKIDTSNLPIKFSKNTGDLTIEVILNSLKIAYYSNLDNNFLGNGLNNYESAFSKHMLNEIVPPYYEVYLLNYNDASNNFSKLLVEFGFFSLFFFYIFIKYTLSNEVPLNQKIFFICIILTQLGRGAGYFNGGFIFSVAMMFSHIFLYNKPFLLKKY